MLTLFRLTIQSALDHPKPALWPLRALGLPRGLGLASLPTHSLYRIHDTWRYPAVDVDSAPGRISAMASASSGWRKMARSLACLLAPSAATPVYSGVGSVGHFAPLRLHHSGALLGRYHGS